MKKTLLFSIIFFLFVNFSFAQNNTFAGFTFPFKIDFSPGEISLLKRLDSMTFKKVTDFANSLRSKGPNALIQTQTGTTTATTTPPQLTDAQKQQQEQQKAQQQQQQLSTLSQLMSGLLGKGFGQGGNQQGSPANQGNQGNPGNNNSNTGPGNPQGNPPPGNNQQESDADKAAREKREKEAREKAEALKKKYEECVKEIGKTTKKEDCDKLKGELEKTNTEDADEGKSGKLKKLLSCSKIGSHARSTNFIILATSLKSKKDMILILPKNYASESAGMDLNSVPEFMINSNLSGKCYLTNDVKKVDTTEKCDGISANVYIATRAIPKEALKDCN